MIERREKGEGEEQEEEVRGEKEQGGEGWNTWQKLPSIHPFLRVNE